MARRRQWLQAAQVWLVEHEPSIKGSLRLAVVVSRERWAHRLAGHSCQHVRIDSRNRGPARVPCIDLTRHRAITTDAGYAAL